MARKKKKQTPGMLADAPALPEGSTAQLPWDRLSRALEDAELQRVFHEARMNALFARAIAPDAPPLPPGSCAVH